jgi:hypothetical protein
MFEADFRGDARGVRSASAVVSANVRRVRSVRYTCGVVLCVVRTRHCLTHARAQHPAAHRQARRGSRPAPLDARRAVAVEGLCMYVRVCVSHTRSRHQSRVEASPEQFTAALDRRAAAYGTHKAPPASVVFSDSCVGRQVRHRAAAAHARAQGRVLPQVYRCDGSAVSV